MVQVADFGLVHPALYPIRVVIMRQDVEDLPLRASVKRLVVPQRVVSVECDYVEHLASASAMSATACAPIASPRPIASSPSLVFALMLIRDTSIPIASASLAFMTGIFCAIFGRSARIVASMLAISKPRSSSSSRTWRRKTKLSAPAQRGSLSEKC